MVPGGGTIPRHVYQNLRKFIPPKETRRRPKVAELTTHPFYIQFNGSHFDFPRALSMFVFFGVLKTVSTAAAQQVRQTGERPRGSL